MQGDPLNPGTAWLADGSDGTPGGGDGTGDRKHMSMPFLKKILCCDCGCSAVVFSAAGKRCPACRLIAEKATEKKARQKSQKKARLSGVNCAGHKPKATQANSMSKQDKAELETFEIGSKRYRRGVSNLGTPEWSVVSTSYPAWPCSESVPYVPRLAVMPDGE